MGRKKTELAYIADPAARRATFKRRKMGLLKKVMELSTLCNVEACAIVFGPDDSPAEVWPPSLTDARRILSRFRSMPKTERKREMSSQEGDAGEIEVENLMPPCLDGRVPEDLSLELEEKMEEFQDPIESLRGRSDVMGLVADWDVGENPQERALLGNVDCLALPELMNTAEEEEALPEKVDWMTDLHEMMNPLEEPFQMHELLFSGGVWDEVGSPEQLAVVDGGSDWLWLDEPLF